MAIDKVVLPCPRTAKNKWSSEGAEASLNSDGEAKGAAGAVGEPQEGKDPGSWAAMLGLVF